MNEPLTNNPVSRALRAGLGMVLFIAALWVIQLVNTATGEGLVQFGIVPRSASGLEGIVFAPFIHGSIEHLAANTIPLLILGFLAAFRGSGGKFVAASAIIIGVSGAGVWLTAAPNSVTIGASGLILGYFGYLLARGVFDHSVADIVVAVVVAVLYGTLIFAVLPTQEGVSWQAHLFGLIGGVLAAWSLRRPRRRDVKLGDL